MKRTLVETFRPAVVTGITPDGWLTRRAGDVIIKTFVTRDGRHEFETVAAGPA